MGRACCILGCPSGGDAPSHQIPKNPALFQKWKSLIYSEKIQHMTDEQISKCAVCYRHFADNDYLVTYRVRKLKRGVAPSLNLPNRPDSSVPIMIKIEPQTSAANRETFTAKEEVTEIPRMMEELETTQITLFKDIPEEIKSCSFDQPQILLDKNIEQTNLTAETFKLNHRERTSRKKRKLTAKQLHLLQCKQQAKQYEKTPSIQKLLSFLTPAEIASIKTRIRKARYAPRIYVRIYHNIAQRKAFGYLKLLED
ncbi:PREDICTED: uncharacterized protein LOC108757656 [Trachymyrmex cornetzi]|uniref:THAP-type domain-containing protein n=1 Tax=Trachymyrmex cornetzi TaxID=471704 RepID=A0A195EHA7_9HYME|nr:PREDICTED: uncharacterized protein LOC108757656 [Trachymyrmex cornetzi]XP_018357644.1 PREDICTED: uncharacterized protein LOC108757656 [Trachymyrmex cornetzi]KYN27244.1 hypothetical protein ALC57_03588 [Trachymyrmex cornetzi]